MCIEGPLSCLEHLENVVEEKGYAVAVVAEVSRHTKVDI